MRRAAGIAIALAAPIALAACKDKPPPSAARAQASAWSEAALAVSARRPARHYFLTHKGAQCEVYGVDPEGTSAPETALCPLDLMIHESIRIAGDTCVRESNDPERAEPVVCPNALTDFERKDHEKRN